MKVIPRRVLMANGLLALMQLIVNHDFDRFGLAAVS